MSAAAAPSTRFYLASMLLILPLYFLSVALVADVTSCFHHNGSQRDDGSLDGKAEKRLIGAFQGGRTRFETYQCVRIARLPFD